jgi:hypothetical protein
LSGHSKKAVLDEPGLPICAGLGFKGKTVETLIPPVRFLVRLKRCNLQNAYSLSRFVGSLFRTRRNVTRHKMKIRGRSNGKLGADVQNSCDRGRVAAQGIADSAMIND